MKNQPEILADENLNENKLKVEKIENLFIMNNENNEGFRVIKLPVKVYGGNPTEFAEYMMEYHQMAVAHGNTEKTMIQRLPIYLKGMARSVYNNLVPANLLNILVLHINTIIKYN